MFQIGMIYTAKKDDKKFRFRAVEIRPSGDVLFADLDDFFEYLGAEVSFLVIRASVTNGIAYLADYKGYGIEIKEKGD